MGRRGHPWTLPRSCLGFWVVVVQLVVLLAVVLLPGVGEAVRGVQERPWEKTEREEGGKMMGRRRR